MKLIIVLTICALPLYCRTFHRRQIDGYGQPIFGGFPGPAPIAPAVPEVLAAPAAQAPSSPATSLDSAAPAASEKSPEQPASEESEKPAATEESAKLVLEPAAPEGDASEGSLQAAPPVAAYSEVNLGGSKPAAASEAQVAKPVKELKCAHLDPWTHSDYDSRNSDKRCGSNSVAGKPGWGLDEKGENVPEGCECVFPVKDEEAGCPKRYWRQCYKLGDDGQREEVQKCPPLVFPESTPEGCMLVKTADADGCPMLMNMCPKPGQDANTPTAAAPGEAPSDGAIDGGAPVEPAQQPLPGLGSNIGTPGSPQPSPPVSIQSGYRRRL